MRITDVVLHHAKSQRLHGSTEHFIFLELKTDEGVTGVGEMDDYLPDGMPSVHEIRQMLLRGLLDRDPFEILSIDRDLRAGPAAYLYGMVPCGVQFALYDIVGKVCTAPVYNLLGGRVRERMPVVFPVFSGQMAIPRQLELIRRAWEKGMRGIRVYTGADTDQDEELLKSIRSNFGERLRIKSLDGPKTTPKRAIQVIKRLQEYGFEYVETPCIPFTGNAEVRAAIDLPVSEHVGDYARARALIEKGCADIFNITVWSGGIQAARFLFNLAREEGLQAVVGTTQELSIATAAQAHLAASVPNIDYPGDPVGPVIYPKDVSGNPVRYEEGSLIVPDGPGLGVGIDRSKLSEILVESAESR